MAVLTKAEYEKKNAVKEEKKVQQESSFVKAKEEIPVEKDQYNYLLFHPENPAEGYLNFKKDIEIKGKVYEFVCKNGTVQTSEKILADRLIKDGYSLISQEEVKDE